MKDENKTWLKIEDMNFDIEDMKYLKIRNVKYVQYLQYQDIKGINFDIKEVEIEDMNFDIKEVEIEDMNFEIEDMNFEIEDMNFEIEDIEIEVEIEIEEDCNLVLISSILVPNCNPLQPQFQLQLYWDKSKSRYTYVYRDLD